jgi:hypothetical protein
MSMIKFDMYQLSADEITMEQTAQEQYDLLRTYVQIQQKHTICSDGEADRGFPSTKEKNRELDPSVTSYKLGFY